MNQTNNKHISTFKKKVFRLIELECELKEKKNVPGSFTESMFEYEMLKWDIRCMMHLIKDDE